MIGNYECENQMSIFDFLDKPQVNKNKGPTYKKGDVVYKVTKGEIEKMTVDHIFSCGVDYYGYSVIKDECFDVFWDYVVGRYVFNSLEEAKQQAEINCQSLTIIRAKDLKPTKQRSFIYYDPKNTLSHGKPYLITATVALIDNMVYSKKWMLYDFLYVFKTKEEAEKNYNKTVEEIAGNKSIFQIETTIQKELKDMYRVDDTKYAHYQYGEH